MKFKAFDYLQTMKRKTKLKSICTLFALLHACVWVVSCSAIDPCDGVACSTGPPRFDVVFVDKESGKDAFAEGRFNPSEVRVIPDNGGHVYSKLMGNGDDKVLAISLPSKAGEVRLTVSLDETTKISLKANVREGKAKCCTNYFAEEIAALDISGELDKKTGYLKIVL